MVMLIGAGAVRYAAAQEESAGIPPGTVLTMQNWKQYQGDMQEGIAHLFAGDYYWKFPADVRISVGPSHDYSLPPVFTANTEKYSHLVHVVNLPNGGHSITGYVAGAPFANPSGPLRGWQILVNSWFTYVPHIQCALDNRVSLIDRYGNTATEVTQTVYRQFNFISDPGIGTSDPDGPGIYYSEYTRVLQPEQSKYTSQLTLYYTDPTKTEDLFLFIPALRRTLRLSSAARCSPFVGTDFTQDDVKQLFNGGIVRFNASVVGEHPILMLTVADVANSTNNANYYQPVFFPKPEVGSWEDRPNYVLDVRRIPSEASGYCFGKRMLYVDKQSLMETWTDLYDANMKYWKSISFQCIAQQVTGVGKVFYGGDYIVDGWDQQNSHLSTWISNPPFGTNEQCAKVNGVNYTDAKLYSSVGGLSSVMQ